MRLKKIHYKRKHHGGGNNPYNKNQGGNNGLIPNKPKFDPSTLNNLSEYIKEKYDKHYTRNSTADSIMKILVDGIRFKNKTRSIRFVCFFPDHVGSLV